MPSVGIRIRFGRAIRRIREEQVINQEEASQSATFRPSPRNPKHPKQTP
jgi:hypothetical protein